MDVRTGKGDEVDVDVGAEVEAVPEEAGQVALPQELEKSCGKGRVADAGSEDPDSLDWPCQRLLCVDRTSPSVLGVLSRCFVFFRAQVDVWPSQHFTRNLLLN